MKKNIIILILIVILAVLAVVFVLQGVLLHKKVSQEQVTLHALQENYFRINQSVREGAATDSDMNYQFVKIQQYNSDLSMLESIGLGKILVGIFVLVLDILILLSVKIFDK